jgi:hypothetical protein
VTAPGGDLAAQIADAFATATAGTSDRLAEDPDAYLELIAAAAQAHEQTRTLLQSTVVSARNAGHSWDQIGRRLGISRQAAQQRFGRGETEGAGEKAQTKRLWPVTVFTEMDALNREGRHGWHSIGFGVQSHTLELSAEQWEHRRVLATAGNLRSAEADGWQRIGETSFPWAYYARPTGKPALPQEA